MEYFFIQIFTIIFIFAKLTQQKEYLVSKEWTNQSLTSSDVSTWSIKNLVLCYYTDWIEYNRNYIMGFLYYSDNQKKTFTGLPPHWSLAVRFDLMLYASLDRSSGDHCEIYLDSVKYGTYDKVDSHNGYYMCYGGSKYGDELILYHQNITHTASTFEFKIVAVTDQDDEGFAGKNFYLHIDTCHNSCLTCNGPSSNNCLSCPTNATKTGNTCTCNSGYNQHINQCVSTCPAGYVKDLNSNTCLNYCDGCSTCNSATQSCTACSSGYYLHKGKCVTSCPVTAPLTSGVCKDFDSTLINGQYILYGLMSDSFNESEIVGMGLSVTGFMGWKDSAPSGALVTNCGQTHLLGGNFLCGKGAVISRSWTGLNPHWSIKIGFTLWKIDSWDSENVYFKVDGVDKNIFTFTATQGSSNICGATYNDLAVPYSVNMTHSSSSLSIQFSTNLDENTYNESFGLRELYILVDFCPSNCASCDGSQCLSCISPYVLYKKQCISSCPTNTYLSSQTCYDCNSNCLTCATTATTCTSCSSPNYLNPDNTCQTTCPTSYYQKDSDRTCVHCHLSCYTCVAPGDQNSCQKCSGSLYLYNNQCLATCPAKYFQNTVSNNNQCLQCHSSCKSCDGSNSTNCLSCDLPLYYQSTLKTCVSSCNTNQFSDNTLVKCVDCNANCKTCSGANSNNCLSCTGSLYFDSTTTSCISTCPNGTYKNTSNNECSSCHSSCYTCVAPGDQNSCQKCSGSLYLYNNQCLASCPAKYYQSTATNNNQCQPCHTSCKSCDGPNSTNCLSCDTSLYLQSKTCIATCPDGTYNNTTNNICTSCDSSCYTCVSPGNANSCQKCSGSLYLYNNQCLATCPAKYFQNTATNNNQCIQCHSSCKSCDGPNSTNCLSCDLPLYYQSTLKTCVSSCNTNQYGDNTLVRCVGCNANCTTCSGVNSNNCLSCTGSLYFDSTTTSCISTCPNGTYKNTSNNVCSSCESTCKTCTGGTNILCSSCNLPRYYQSLASPPAKSCDLTCLSNQYKNDSTPSCDSCEASCTTCDGPFSTNCTGCSGSLYLNKTTKSCNSTCPTGTYKDTTNHECTSCHTDCKTCTGKLQNECSSCTFPLYFQSSSTSCVSICNSNQYKVDTPTPTCQNCNSSCKTCTGSANNNCTSCNVTYLNTSDNTCGSTCPSGTYQNSSNHQCSPCHSDCKTCTGPNNNECTSCTLPKYFQSSSFTCVNTCNTNQYQNDPTATCNSCHATCATCSGNAINNCKSCSGSLFLNKQINSSTCESTCPSTQYKNSVNNECTNCESTCATCNGGTKNNCLSCDSPLFFQSSTSSCDSDCLSNQYKSTSPSRQCLQCHSTCETCSGPSDTECKSCSGTDLFLQDPASGSSSCKSLCPDGKYKNTSNQQCSQCDTTCKTCSNSGSNKCLTCQLPRYFHPTTNECVLSCDTNQYQDNPTATCMNCHTNCTTCSASSDTSCLSCSDTLFLNKSTHECLNSCPDTYYKNTSNNECTKCESSCYLCDGGTKNDCLSCQLPNYYQQDTKSCGISCYSHQYKDNGLISCASCDPNCKTCSDKNDNNCLSCSGSTFLNSSTKTCDSQCQLGQYKNIQNNECTLCESTCKTCDGGTDTSCLSCTLPRLFQSSSHQCVESCNSNQYNDNSIPECMQCHQTCTSCSGPSQNECTKCSGLTFLDPLTNSCVSTCPGGYYKNITNNKCTLCESSCKNCDGGSSQDCLDCSLPLYYQSSSKECVANCNSNQYKDDNAIQCQKCHTECTTCSGPQNNQCNSCEGLRFLNSTTHKCDTTCPDGQYPNSSDHTCTECENTCKTCNGGLQTNCISCTLPRYYQSSISTCVLSCQLDQYKEDATVSCQQCHNTCTSCSGPNKNQCLTCSGVLFLNPMTNECVSKCPDSYYADINDNTCQKCDISCKTCNNKFDTSCLTCELPLYYHALTSKCVSTCDSNQYKDNSQVQCIKCHAECKTCSGPSSTECLTCSNNTYLSDQKSCIDDCPNIGEYEDLLNNTCSKCDPDCLSCGGGTKTECLTCQLPRYFQEAEDTCVLNCYSNQYKDDNDAWCKDCHNTCDTCTGPSNNECKTCTGTKYFFNNECIDTCPDGMYAEKSNNTCQKCSSSCQKCDGATSNHCLSCNTGTYLYQNQCLSQCPNKFYNNISTLKCSACSNQCENCTGSTSTSCLSCPIGYLLEETYCVVSCSSAYFQEKNSPKCTLCNTSCKTCSGGTNKNCTSCQNSTYLHNGECLSICPDGTYSDTQYNTCNQCHSTCSTCSGESASQCNKCDSKRFLYNNTCLTQCPDGHYNNSSNQECSLCDKKCLTCTTGSDQSCQSCSGSLYLYQNQCISTCPDGFYQDKSTNQCGQCNSVCSTCTSFTSNSCITCKNGTFLEQNTCVSKCSNGTYGENSSKTCEKCNSTCDTCNGPSKSQCDSCSGTLFKYENQCSDTCPSGYYQNISNNTCSKCDQSCENCTGVLITQCSSCASPLFFNKNQCLSSCPNATYKSPQKNSCEQCDKKCQNCNGPSEKECLSCKTGTIIQETQCLKQCNEGFYENSEKKQCSKCHPSCTTCSGPNANQKNFKIFYNKKCETCPDLLNKYENKCVSECPNTTYLAQNPSKQCFACSDKCSSSCNGPEKEDCESIKPSSQLIVMIICLKTIFWIFSMVIGVIKDRKDNNQNKIKVIPLSLPNNIDYSQLDPDSPIKRRIKQGDDQNTSLGGSPILQKQSISYNTPEHKPTQADSSPIPLGSSLFPTQYGTQLVCNQSNDQSPIVTKRKQRMKSQFILNSKGHNRNQSQLTQVSLAPSAINTKRDEASQIFDKSSSEKPVMSSTVYPSTVFMNESSSTSTNIKEDKVQSNKKIKFSLLGNEWVSLFTFYDQSLSRVNRCTIIYLKYQMFFFVCNQFSMSPLYFVLACLTTGLALKLVLSQFLVFITKQLRFGNIVSIIMFISSIISTFSFWFIPTLISLKYIKDINWSIMYLVTFAIDFLVLQQVIGLIQYLCSIRHINKVEKGKALNNYFKNQHMIERIQK